VPICAVALKARLDSIFDARSGFASVTERHVDLSQFATFVVAFELGPTSEEEA
jgi:hypothetical protein